MNKEQAMQLIKQAVTLLQCDYDSRVKLIEAVNVIEAEMAKVKTEGE